MFLPNLQFKYRPVLHHPQGEPCSKLRPFYKIAILIVSQSKNVKYVNFTKLLTSTMF